MPADHDPNDETVLRQPAAPISPQEIAEMRNAFRRTTPGRWNWWTSNSMYRLSTTHDGKDGGVLHAFVAKDGVPDISMSQADRAFVEMAHERFPALLDAIEALTAKNQHLTDALNQTVQEATAAIDDRLKPEIERLTAENARLTSENADLRHDIERALAAASAEAAEVERLTDKLALAKTLLAMQAQPEPTDDRPLTEVFADLRAVVAASPEAQAGIAAYLAEQAEERWQDGTIYDAYRRRVEAAPAASKEADEAEGLRPLTPDEIEAGSYLLSHAKDGGIPTSPLSHPGYPALVEMARESMRDGD